MPRRAIVLGLGALLLLSAAIWWLRARARQEPTADDWIAARKIVWGGFQEGDGVRIEPSWLRDVGQHFAGVAGRGVNAVELDWSFPPDPLYLARHKRLWIVAAPGHEDSSMGIPGMAPEITEAASGGLTVRRYGLPPSPILADLTPRIRLATVERWIAGGTRRRCVWDTRHHDCHGRHSYNVSVERVEAGGAPRQCIVVRPSPVAGAVGMTWSKVRLGAGLLLRSGFTTKFVRGEVVTDAHVAVRIDGREVAARIEPAGEWRWHSTWIDTAERKGELADVAIEASAEQDPAPELCLEVVVLAEPIGP